MIGKLVIGEACFGNNVRSHGRTSLLSSTKYPVSRDAGESFLTCTRPDTGALKIDVRMVRPFHSTSRGRPTFADKRFIRPCDWLGRNWTDSFHTDVYTVCLHHEICRGWPTLTENNGAKWAPQFLNRGPECKLKVKVVMDASLLGCS